MSSHHETLHTKSLVWTSTLPDPFTGARLPGSILISTRDEFGSVTIQEYNTADFSILFTIADLNTPFSFKTKTDTAGWLIRILLKGNNITYNLSDLKWTLFKNQFAVLKSAQPQITTHFKNPGRYTDLSFFIHSSLIEEMLPLFPWLQQQLPPFKINKDYLVCQPAWADIEILNTIQSILNCTYENQLRLYYFDTKIKDLLFNILLQLNNEPAVEKLVSQKEREAILLAEKMITEDITIHFRIPELAKKVALNENRFKIAFKKIFGSGPYEYLVHQRMTKAVVWLQSGKSVKETAALTGYRPSDFTVAFINHYGFTPSSVKTK